MSYPQPPSDPHFYGPQSVPPPYAQHVHQTKPTDKSRRFLNMTGGVLAAVITGVVLLCCVLPLGVCFLGGFAELLQPLPTAHVTSCKVDDSGFFQGAEIGYTINNNESGSASYVIEFVVKDAAGAQVGHATDYVNDLAGKTSANRVAHASLDAKGGKTCHLLSIE